MKFKFDIYRRSFRRPLRTSHGLWQIREGIIIKLENEEGKSAFGEIAPLPWFGSETFSQALNFCQRLRDTISVVDITQISNELPACQFAFESAWLQLNQTENSHCKNKNLDLCYLLPAGKEALKVWKKIYITHANSTFKWKIGVLPLSSELEILQKLVFDLPPQSKLRLDANGGLDLEQAEKLLAMTDKINSQAKSSNNAQVEFIEQILPPHRFAEMSFLSRNFNTYLALDESVANFQQLKIAYEKGWRSIFVLKLAIMGYPSKIINFCQINSLDIVISSVFEREIGRNIVLNMAQQLDHPRALGFGANYFDNVK